MDFIKVRSLQLFGLESQQVTIEALRSRGICHLLVTGLPDAWLRDSRDKIKSLVGRMVDWGPLDRILVHLLPPEENKNGAHLELAIVVACLALLDAEQLSAASLHFLRSHLFVGAVSLEGSLQSTSLSAVFEQQHGERLVGPHRFATLAELWAFVRQPQAELPMLSADSEHSSSAIAITPEQNIEGRYWERFLLLCSAIAEIPVLLVGPPGAGKSHLAAWAQCLLPAPSATDWSQILQLWSLGSRLPPTKLPCLTPHSRTHLSEFIGISRRNVMRPGFFSLAHKGLLILNEFPEMNRDCREILRTVLDDKRVLKATASGIISWPADFWLIATANPCPCGGRRGSTSADCQCPRTVLLAYQQRFSGPLLDRFGLKLFVPIDDQLELKDASYFQRLLSGKTIFAELVGQKRAELGRRLPAALRQIEVLPEFRAASTRERIIKTRLLAAMQSLAPAVPADPLALIALLQRQEQSLFDRSAPIFGAS